MAKVVAFKGQNLRAKFVKQGQNLGVLQGGCAGPQGAGLWRGHIKRAGKARAELAQAGGKKHSLEAQPPGLGNNHDVERQNHTHKTHTPLV